MLGQERELLLTLKPNDMSKNERSAADLQKELMQLRKKNLRLRLDLDVLVLEPKTERARKIREQRLVYHAIGRKKTPDFVPEAKVADVEPAQMFFR